VLCIQCHSAEGFTRVQVNGETLTQDEIDRVAERTLALGHSVTCNACHGRRADGEFVGTSRNPLRMEKRELCGRCHNAETVTFEDFRTRGEVVRHPQREMLSGTAGAASPGTPDSATTPHSLIPENCVACHYPEDRGIARHDFRANVATCAECHPGLTTFDRPAAGDFDGDGRTQGVQTEVTGLLERLKSALLLDVQVTFDGRYFDYGGATDHALSGATDAQKRAVFNWYSVADDKSLGVHNTTRAVNLLQGSYKELVGVDVPGAVLR
jgi:hypothetical protein